MIGGERDRENERERVKGRGIERDIKKQKMVTWKGYLIYYVDKNVWVIEILCILKYPSVLC